MKNPSKIKINKKKSAVTNPAFQILILSFLVIAFCIWVVYFNPNTQKQLSDMPWISKLPKINAMLNCTSLIFVLLAIFSIKKKKIKLHILFIIIAILSSTLFFCSYTTYHYFHGDTKYQGIGIIRKVYFFILISHIVGSILLVPLIFSTLYNAGRKKFDFHRKFGSWTYPIWLYVSLTGIIVYFMLL